MPTMRALVVAPDAPGGIELRDVTEADPAPNEAVVAVGAVSLNRGEVRRAQAADEGFRPGWDVAGEVLARAADGSGPPAGTRVVGMADGEGWAERVAVPTAVLAPLPDNLGLVEASTLPVAGLTAMRALAVAERLDGKRVLVTGAAGGVGRFAIQLASHGGAHVTAVVSRPERSKTVEALGCADEIIVGDLPDHGGYDVILESVGGPSLAAAFGLVAPGGTIVSYGNSSGAPSTFDVTPFYRRGGSHLYGLYVFDEVQRHNSGVRDLTELARAAASDRLDTGVSLVLDWADAATAMKALMDREVDGKAVLTLS